MRRDERFSYCKGCEQNRESDSDFQRGFSRKDRNISRIGLWRDDPDLRPDPGFRCALQLPLLLGRRPVSEKIAFALRLE
jgi:hypothetical protein